MREHNQISFFSVEHKLATRGRFFFIMNYIFLCSSAILLCVKSFFSVLLWLVTRGAQSNHFSLCLILTCYHWALWLSYYKSHSSLFTTVLPSEGALMLLLQISIWSVLTYSSLSKLHSLFKFHSSLYYSDLPPRGAIKSHSSLMNTDLPPEGALMFLLWIPFFSV